MKRNSEIIVVLDRSGSMNRIKQATIEGFNSFLAEQQAVEGKAYLTLVQFDHEYEVVYSGIDIHEVMGLTDTSYEPRGTTALLDAIGRTFEETRDRLFLSKKEEEDNQVVFMIITDGQENASKEYSRKHIFNMIRKGEERYKWQFVFLGANQDAIEEGTRLGVQEKRAMTFASDTEGTGNMFVDLSINIAEMRLGEKDFAFRPSQRMKQKR